MNEQPFFLELDAQTKLHQKPPKQNIKEYLITFSSCLSYNEQHEMAILENRRAITEMYVMRYLFMGWEFVW